MRSVQMTGRGCERELASPDEARQWRGKGGTDGRELAQLGETGAGSMEYLGVEWSKGVSGTRRGRRGWDGFVRSGDGASASERFPRATPPCARCVARCTSRHDGISKPVPRGAGGEGGWIAAGHRAPSLAPSLAALVESRPKTSTTMNSPATADPHHRLYTSQSTSFQHRTRQAPGGGEPRAQRLRESMSNTSHDSPATRLCCQTPPTVLRTLSNPKLPGSTGHLTSSHCESVLDHGIDLPQSPTFNFPSSPTPSCSTSEHSAAAVVREP